MRKISRSVWITAAVAAVALMAVAVSLWRFAPSQPARPIGMTAPGPVVPTAEPMASTARMEPARMTSLALVLSEDGREACASEGRWCVSLSEEADDEGMRRPVVRPAGQGTRRDAPADDIGDGETYAVWPQLIVLADGSFLAGVETRTSTSYSGGGGSATSLRLFRVSTTGAASAASVLDLPVRGALLIRACFSEADVQSRGEACHDEYGFTAQVVVEPAKDDMPPVRYSTQAWAFPRGASRDADSTSRGPLRPDDLVRERDEACSFSRRFEFDQGARKYEADRPLPDCSAYTVP